MHVFTMRMAIEHWAFWDFDVYNLNRILFQNERKKKGTTTETEPQNEKKKKIRKNKNKNWTKIVIETSFDGSNLKSIHLLANNKSSWSFKLLFDAKAHWINIESSEWMTNEEELKIPNCCSCNISNFFRRISFGLIAKMLFNNSL